MANPHTVGLIVCGQAWRTKIQVIACRLSLFRA
jgi:hypothetical protein